MAYWNVGRGRGRAWSEASRERQLELPIAIEETPYHGQESGSEPRPEVREREPRAHLLSEQCSGYGGSLTPGTSRYYSSMPSTSQVPVPSRTWGQTNQNTFNDLSPRDNPRCSGTPSSSSKKDMENPIWPADGFCKEGTLGVPTKLFANYFAVEQDPQRTMYQYHVTFNPDVENIFMRRAMVYKHTDVLGQKILFDGMALWSFNMLEKEVTELLTTRLSDGAEIRIEIKFISSVCSGDVVTSQILGTQMKKYFSHIGFKPFGRGYFDVNDSRTLEQHGLEIIPGFTTAIHQNENTVLMNCNSTFKFIRRDNVLDLIRDCFKSGPNFRELCEKKLLGQIVLTMYNNKTYKIAEISWNIRPRDTFERKGHSITYIDYMKQTWNLNVDDPDQPMLLSKPKAKDIRRGENKPILLVPQFCILTGIDDETRKNFSAMRDVANHTRINPTERVQHLQTFINRLKTNEQVQQEMKEWGLDFAENLQEIQGRTLQPEGIILTTERNDRGAKYNPREADWSKILRSKPLLEAAHLINWIVVCTNRDKFMMNDFITKMRIVCPPMGITVSNPAIFLCVNDRTQSYIQSISRHVGDHVQMIVAIIPPDRKELYDAIKKLCCVQYGILSQVITSRTLNKRNTLMSITNKIAIQMNCKLGGQAWRVNTQKGTMVVGIDTYHDSTQRNMSVCGVVCSINDFYTKYFSQVSFQEQGQEMSNILANQIAAGLKRNCELNKRLPDRVIIYRDGVSDGDVFNIKEWEVKQILEALSAQGPNYKPEVIFVIVNKTITTRLFKPAYFVGGGDSYGASAGPSSNGYEARRGAGPSYRGYSPRGGWSGRGGSTDHRHGGGDQYENPLPGTIVDSVITRPERFDFFLISQSVRQGTVSPTYYNVIYTSSNISVNDLQLFTYQLCHLYYNWQGTVRVPVPVLYAHKLASLVGDSIHAAPSDALADTLYYL